ncbi:MAG: ResB-like family protein [Cycloclasticus sp. symbiont of Poecilosclerida sp. N]|nr:MAG: ResB-like family protein [Cycloclasticus sp. symbiont of Poecilosclerida sp. N]
MNKQSATHISTSRTAALLLKFLGSMNLAISLLIALSIAAIIGTVLQQNQPYTDYIIKFGPFWFEVFNQMGLYDVYSSAWFLFILSFLVLSTSTCIYRNAPNMLREMREYRQNIQLETLENYANSHSWQITQSVDEIQHVIQKIFPHNGYSTRLKEGDGFTLIAGMRGAGSRMGYIFTHLAIVLICIGGLIDGNAILKAKETFGQLTAETRNIPANEVPSGSRLGVDNLSFRGSVSIPEGSQSDVLFINYKDGYLVQELPFSVQVKDFRIEHYSSGQPKSFESDLVIHDERLDEPLEKTISVNYPLIYDGYSIYQASFSDGGSELELLAWPLKGVNKPPKKIEAIVGNDLQLNLFKQPWILETSDFRLFNINPSEDPAEKFKNAGPSVQFKMRDKTGEAKEFLNYMVPVEREGFHYYLSGVRSSPDEEFRYLYVPVDDAGSIKRFMNYLAALSDEALLREIVVNENFTGTSGTPFQEVAQFNEAMIRLTGLFIENGMNAVIGHIEDTVPAAKREEVTQLYMRVLQQMLGAVYIDVLKKEGVDVSLGVDEEKAVFFDAASAAIGAIGHYGSPVYFQLSSFVHHQASGLQIAKAPGKNLVYPSCAMLILGVFLMFYAPQQRLWAHLEPVDGGVRLVFAGHAIRDKLGFEKQYKKIQAQFDRVLTS